MISNKAFNILAVDMLGNVEVLGTFLTYDLAKDVLFRLEEGDDKHSPCTYTIEEVDTDAKHT